jgi:hypothetical protein
MRCLSIICICIFTFFYFWAFLFIGDNLLEAQVHILPLQGVFISRLSERVVFLLFSALGELRFLLYSILSYLSEVIFLFVS